MVRHYEVRAPQAGVSANLWWAATTFEVVEPVPARSSVGKRKRPPEGGHNLSPSPSHVALTRDALLTTVLQPDVLSRGSQKKFTTELTPSRHDLGHKFLIVTSLAVRQVAFARRAQSGDWLASTCRYPCRREKMLDLVEIELKRIRKMAEHADNRFLVYLIDMAILEAGRVARANAMANLEFSTEGYSSISVRS